ncbi:MAG: integration host factor subunit beta [Myxococcales bacterium]|nr:integration host factor subunit beta [Myxococcales bacterium]
MQGTVTKSELIEHISEQLKLPTGKAEQIVNCVFDSMVKALQEGEGIEIRGFGSFTVREYKAYEGRNPRTGETVQVAPKRLPFFKVGKDLRERVNRSRETAPGEGPKGIASAPSSIPASAPTGTSASNPIGHDPSGYGGGNDSSGGNRF